MLLSAGADVDTEDENGDTPFVHALQARHSTCMTLLREAGCTTEIAKMSAALVPPCDPEFVRLCHSMDVPVENEDWNAVDTAEVAVLLSELQLDPFVGQYGRHGFADSPFMYIVQEGRPDVLEMMVSRHPCLQKYVADDLREMYNAALFKAIRSRRLDNVKLLLEKLGADRECRDAQGRTPFVLACGHDETTAWYLMDSGVEVGVVDGDGLTALHWAACAGRRSLTSGILERGAIAVDTQADLGATPLMVACAARHLDVAEMLLEAGADADSATPDGWRALHVAVRSCAAPIVRLLLTKGRADPDAVSSSLTHGGDSVPGSTPLLIAISLNSVRMLRHLVDAGADVNLAGHVTAAAHLQQSSISSGSESDDAGTGAVSDVAQLTCTPVQFAIVSRAWDIAELLIRAGCVSSSVTSWLDPAAGFPSPLVSVPHEHAAYLRRLIGFMSASPARLSHIARLHIRRRLGRQLASKLTEMNLPLKMQQYLLFYDLFNAHSGSFDI